MTSLPTTARDELSDIILDCGEYIPGSHADDYVNPYKAADAILAAGYRKPRTITTAEDLDKLGRGSTIVEPNGCVWVNDGQSEDPWASFGEDPWGGPIWTDSSRITLPVTVIR